MVKEGLKCGKETIVDVGVELKDARRPRPGRQSETQEARYDNGRSISRR